MKDKWDKAYNNLVDFHQKFQELVEILPQSKAYNDKKKIIKKLWDKTMRSFNSMSQYISDVQSIDIEIPKGCEIDKFLDAWQYWKDYLNEQHGIKMKSRMENKQLKLLWDISKKNTDKAIFFLDFAESKGYRNFFVVNEEDKQKPDGVSKYQG